MFILTPILWPDPIIGVDYTCAFVVPMTVVTCTSPDMIFLFLICDSRAASFSYIGAKYGQYNGLWRQMKYQNVDDKIPQRSMLIISPCRKDESTDVCTFPLILVLFRWMSCRLLLERRNLLPIWRVILQVCNAVSKILHYE